VVNYGDDSVTPISLATRNPGTRIGVGHYPTAIAITPDGTKAYVVHYDNSSACLLVPAACESGTLINLDTRTRGTELKFGSSPAAIAITHDGKTAYVVNSNPQGPWSAVKTSADAIGVMAIDLATDTGGTSILGRFGEGFQDPVAIALTPKGNTAYVANYVNGSVTPINLVTNTVGPAIRVGIEPIAIAITPDGATAYVVNNGDDSVIPINLATKTAGPAIRVGKRPDAIAITPDGTTGYVVNQGDDTVTPINLATKSPGPAIHVGHLPQAIAITSDGTTAYVVNSAEGTVMSIDLARGTRT
jgi:YVTN family beta-propeller protein